MPSPANQTTDGKPLFGRDCYVLEIDGLAVGVFRSISGLSVNIEVLEYHEGGRNDMVHNLPGRITYPKLVLERGLTDENEMYRWFEETTKKALKKEVTVRIEQMGSTGVTRTFTFADAYPVSWTGPDLNADGGDIATERVEVVHGGMRPA